MYLNDVFTVPGIAWLGMPGISVPAGLDSGRACRWGYSCIGKPFDEETVFAVARRRWKKRAAGFHTAMPADHGGGLGYERTLCEAIDRHLGNGDRA